MDTSRNSDTLYHEEHKNVTVMFASIPNFMDYFAENDNEDGGLHCLEVLNSIITAFDAVIDNCIAVKFERNNILKYFNS